MNKKLLSHPIYDHQKPPPCPDPLSLHDFNPETREFHELPQAQADASAPHAQLKAQRPPGHGWGGRRPGAGAPQGNLNHLKHGQRSALIRRAVEVLAEHKELRPFLLLIARAAVDGEIPQTTRQLIIESLGKTTLGMQLAAVELRRLRDGQATR